MADFITPGDRVRRLRKLRGMTQDDLRRASGLSLRTVKDIENGNGNHRNETLHKLAVALRVRTSDLTTPGEPERQQVPGEPWEDVRSALYRRAAAPEPEEPATARGVLTALTNLTPAWRAGAYSQVRPALPGLVRDAMSLGDSEEERSAKARALAAAAWILNMTRQFGDAWAAAALARDAAPDLPDILAAVSMQCWCLLRQGRTGEAAVLAARWADCCEPRFSRATTGELAAFGKMLLYVANAAAADSRPGDAADALSLARAAAARIGRDVPFSAATTARFGPVTVSVITAESAVLTWRPDTALALAERVRGQLGVIEPAQALRHRLDVANAHAMKREYGDAVEVMAGLHREAPEWLRNQQYARDVLEGVLRRRRGPWTRELRSLAEAVRLPL